MRIEALTSFFEAHEIASSLIEVSTSAWKRVEAHENAFQCIQVKSANFPQFPYHTWNPSAIWV
jgi:hypothetical protein